MKPVFTTGDVARYCHVSLGTVNRWIEKGHLPAHTTPDGDHRILRSEFRAFLERNSMPIDETFFQELESKKRILIVEDERYVLELIARALNHYDDRFETASTSDPLDALMLVSSFRPHLVTLDLMMAGGDGLQIFERIRANPDTAHVKILVVTDSAAPETIERVMALSADGYMRKPLNIRELLAKVHRLLPAE